jgi:general secretion pathway protein D
MRQRRARLQSSVLPAQWRRGAAAGLAAFALLAAAPASHAADTIATPAARTGSDNTVVLNFVNADLEAVVRAIGQFTGRTFVIDPRVKGTLTLVTERPVTREQAFEELLSALRLQGFTLVESSEPGGVARILPEADAKLQGGRVVAPPAQTAPRGDQVVTQVFRLQYESATNMVPVLRPLIAPNNTISAYPANNSLVITDYAENLRRLARIIEAIDSPATAEVEVVPLQYGLATDVAAILSKALDEGARSAGQVADAGQRVAVIAEPRTNMLILRGASRSRLEQAKLLIARFDQPNLTPGNINVVYLRNAQAVKLAPLLRAVLSSDPSFIQQASGSGLTVTPVSTTLGQSSTNPQQTPASQTSQQQATGGGYSGSGYGGGTSSGGAGGSGSAVAGLIQADPATNSLIISAPEPLYRNIRAIIDRLDVRPAQVMIESLVVELTGQQAAEFGIQWQALNGLTGDTTRFVGGTNFGTGGANIINLSQNIGAPAPGLNIGIVKGQISIPGTNGSVTITNLGLLARALETVANTNILSRPNIQTLDNEEGKFLVGQNVGLITGAYAATGAATTSTVNPFQTFERHDVGLQLSVKPQISEGGTVRMAIYIEDSSIVQGTAADNPVLNKRSFQTNVLVEDGSFVVISGLIQDQADEQQNKVPWLGNLPLIGRLFRYDTRDHIKTQTMVFLRPTIIRDESVAADIALNRYDYIRTQVSQTHQPGMTPLPDLSVDNLPPAPAPARQKPPPATAPASPNSESLPVSPPGATPPSKGPETKGPEAKGPEARDAAATDIAMSGVAQTAAGSGSGRSKPQLIQVSEVHDLGQGHELQQRLKEAGFDSDWDSVRTADGDVVRIRVAVERRAAKIAEALAMLRRLGYDPLLIGQ